MKRFLASFLVFSLFLLPACSSTLPDGTAENETTAAPDETAQPAKTEEPVDTYDYPKFEKIIGWEELNAIPVAQPGMSEDQLRAIVAEYMNVQARITWTPDKSFHYTCTGASAADASGYLYFKKGVRYYGQPYDSAAGDAAAILAYIDPETGVLSVPGDGQGVPTLFGNNCATAVFWAWSRVSTTITYYGTHTMTPKNGIVILGDIDYNVPSGDYRNVSTKEICEKNGTQRMFEAYAKLKIADGVVGFITGGNHHAMLVVQDAVVVRNSDGTIDGSQSYVLMTEEYSPQKASGGYTQLGGYFNKYTFKQLFASIYIPISIAELQGTKEMEKAWVKCELPETVTVEELTKAAVTSNYAVSAVTFRVLNADGSVAYEAVSRGEAKESPRSVSVVKTGYSRILKRAVSAGSYTLVIDVRLGNGETYEEFYRGTLTV